MQEDISLGNVSMLSSVMEETLVSEEEDSPASESGRAPNRFPMSACPRPVSLIIGSEFCERFSFSGLRSVLSLYLRNELLYSENQSTVIYHVFIMVCNVVPVLGAVLADGCLGRFNTVLYFSVLCAVGNVVMSLAATPPVGLSPVTFTVLGLGLIATGTGGIKPCVVAFGGDQFRLPEQAALLPRYFTIFYFVINLGGFLGVVLTPLLRTAVPCFSDDVCYPLGFGVLTVFMFLSLLLFVIGKPLYRIRYPKQNVIVRFASCALYAIAMKLRSRKPSEKTSERSHQHWLDFASKKFDAKLISDMKGVLSILFLFLPLPIFWSLFDQQGSRWIFQASRMNGSLLGFRLMPDQIQFINPAAILILIPLFDKAIFPAMENVRFLTSPLQKMLAGGFLAGAAFLCSAGVEYKLAETYPVLPSAREMHLNIINTLPCDVTVETLIGRQGVLMRHGGLSRLQNITSVDQTSYQLRAVVIPESCGGAGPQQQELSLQLPFHPSQVETILFGVRNSKLTAFVSGVEDVTKSLNGNPKLRLTYLRSNSAEPAVTITVTGPQGLIDAYYMPSIELGVSPYMELSPGSYTYYVTYEGSDKEFQGPISLGPGGVYNLILKGERDVLEFFKLFVVTPPNAVHMLWMAPQFLLMAVAEIMFALSGIEFSFVQAPRSMKTVVMAAWYVCVACGNLLVILITQAQLFTNQAQEFYLFAALMVVDMAFFVCISAGYTSKPLESDDSTALIDDPDENYPLLATSTREVLVP